MSERDDERVSEPPRLGGEAHRYRNDAGTRILKLDGTVTAVFDGDGKLWDVAPPTQDTAALAAELAACRARCDEGDGEAWRLVNEVRARWPAYLQAATRASQAYQQYENGSEDWTVSEETAEAEMYASQAALEDAEKAMSKIADEARALLARRATATTATPAGGPWLVVICREGVSEVTPFDDEADAVSFFDQASANWSDSYLCRATRWPKDVHAVQGKEPAR